MAALALLGAACAGGSDGGGDRVARLEKRVAALEERLAQQPADVAQLAGASVEELVERLDSADALARYHSAEALDARFAEAKVDLLHALSTGSVRQREAVAALLVQHASADLGAELVAAHPRNPEARVRMFLDAALARTGAVEAVDLLAADLASSSLRLRLVACEGLGRLGAAPGALPLALVLSSGDPVLQPVAIASLKRIGPDGVAHLETVWTRTGERERLALLRAASQVEGFEADAFLAAKLEDAAPFVALEAARLLGKRGSLAGRDVALARIGSEDPAIVSAARAALDAMESGAQP